MDRILSQMDPLQRAIARALRAVILEAGPELHEEVKWGVPCFMAQKLVCSIATHADHTNLEFYRGAALRDAKHLLEGTGKSLRHVKFHALADVQPSRLKPLLREAIALDAA